MSDMWNPPRVMTHRLRTTDLDEVVSLGYLWNKVQDRRSIPRLLEWKLQLQGRRDFSS